jgi:hypothetical protein
LADLDFPQAFEFGSYRGDFLLSLIEALLVLLRRGYPPEETVQYD